MLRISRLADYAVAIVGYYGWYPGAHSATEIAEGTGLQLPTVRKVLKLLARADIVRASRGLKGGYSLHCDYDKLNLAEVIEAVDGPMLLLDCLGEGPDTCSVPNCAMKPRWAKVNEAVRHTLADIPVKDMITPERYEYKVNVEELRNV